MSGHSKWAQIKRKKGVTDKKRGQLFSKMLRIVSVAARTEPNPQFNPTLRSAIQKAKELNVPSENIEKAIHKSSEQKDLEELVMEGYGPEGVALLIVALTDNRNRTVAEIKKILSDHSCKWADPGSVLWAFRKEGDEWIPSFPLHISPEAEELLSAVYNDLDEHDDVVDIFTSADEPQS